MLDSNEQIAEKKRIIGALAENLWHVNNSGQKRLRAKVTNWSKAKKSRTSSIFDTITPLLAKRAFGPQWQESREKPHVLAFWPTLWPRGGRVSSHAI
jgi:hypothetical protein